MQINPFSAINLEASVLGRLNCHLSRMWEEEEEGEEKLRWWQFGGRESDACEILIFSDTEVDEITKNQTNDETNSTQVA